MKIGIIGMGYWGNILLRNLEQLRKAEIIICDISSSKKQKYLNHLVIDDYKKIDCDCVFIATPTLTHFEICKYFINKKIKIFCEKPLTPYSSEAKILYDLAFKNETLLFTDWIYTYNTYINTIKRDYNNGKLGKIKSVSMKRLNCGPMRYDVNARWDLASHDISIIQYIFSENPKDVKWIDYKRNKKSKQDDSSLILIQFENFSVNINVSWHYRKKIRECIFEFENYFVVFDDLKRFLQYEDLTDLNYPGNLSYPSSEVQEPLKNSINMFFKFKKDDMIIQKDLTMEIIKILELEL